MLAWLLLSCQLAQVLALCPTPFTEQAGLCVFVNTAQSFSWCSANQRCASIGGELINSHSSVKLLVGNNISSANCGCNLWVGLSDLADERNKSRAGWQRVNGNGGFQQDNSLFPTSEPSGGTAENCLRRAVNLLADAGCGTLYGFVCEFAAAGDAALMTGIWKKTAFKRIKFNSEYCFTDVPDTSNELQCKSAAMLAGSSRHVLYNSKLRSCRLLQFTDAQVEQGIETSPDWSKFSLMENN